MRVMLVGNGSREHAIAWKLCQSPRLTKLFVAPGNAGTADIAQNVPISATDIEKLLDFALKRHIDFTVVGPEAPLAEGIVDRFQDVGLLIFGPTKAAARIESSKIFAKELMLAHDVPTGIAKSFSSYGEARTYVQTCPVPLVVKADGLAAGKGVIVARMREDALDALSQCMETRQFGAAGERVLIEEFLEGQEVSVFAFVDGEYVSTMVAACDYKRVGDGNTGPNTGGMGSYSPPAPSAWNSDIKARVRAEIMEPVAKALADMGSPYRGVLYLGMILTKSGPKVIEFNCRLGDPETQVVLPRLKTDLAEIMLATAQGKLEGFNIEWDSRACVGVVVASGGYPGSYKTGYPVCGLDEMDEDIIVFHAGTKAVHQEGEPLPTIVTDGGRVLAVAAMGETVADARRRVYDNVERVHFTGAFFRKDIAALGEDHTSVPEKPL